MEEVDKSQAKRVAMTPRSGKGKELCDLLRRELQIPERVKSFSVSFAVGDVVKVVCEYMPTEVR